MASRETSLAIKSDLISFAIAKQSLCGPFSKLDGSISHTANNLVDCFHKDLRESVTHRVQVLLMLIWGGKSSIFVGAVESHNYSAKIVRCCRSMLKLS